MVGCLEHPTNVNGGIAKVWICTFQAGGQFQAFALPGCRLFKVENCNLGYDVPDNIAFKGGCRTDKYIC